MQAPSWRAPEAQRTEADHLALRHSVAKEHLVGGMPVVDLHRNHDIPLNRVRRWIELVRSGGSAALAEAIANERRPLESYR